MDGLGTHVKDPPSLPASVLALLTSEPAPPTPWQTVQPPPLRGTHRHPQLLPLRLYIQISPSGPQLPHPLVPSLWLSGFTVL